MYFKVIKLFLFIGLSFAAIQFESNAQTVESAINRNMKYLALGDSYTIGESVNVNDRWPVQLANKIGIDPPQIIAKTGWTTDELTGALETVKLTPPYDLVSLLIGVNNQYRGRSSEEFRTEFIELLNQAIEYADDNKRRVFVVSIPDWGVMPFAEGRNRKKIAKEIDEFNSIVENESKKAGISFFDITPISRRAKKDKLLVANDGLHPSGKMYAEWVELIYPSLLKQLENE